MWWRIANLYPSSSSNLPCALMPNAVQRHMSGGQLGVGRFPARAEGPDGGARVPKRTNERQRPDPRLFYCYSDSYCTARLDEVGDLGRAVEALPPHLVHAKVHLLVREDARHLREEALEEGKGLVAQKQTGRSFSCGREITSTCSPCTGPPTQARGKAATPNVARVRVVVAAAGGGRGAPRNVARVGAWCVWCVWRWRWCGCAGLCWW